MIFLVTFPFAFLLNLYIIIFGKKDLTALKEKISIKKYITEIDESLKSLLGENNTKIFKGVLGLLSVIFVIFNAIAFIECLLAVLLGTFAAKKSYQIPCVSNILNKIATYINRLR